MMLAPGSMLSADRTDFSAIPLRCASSIAMPTAASAATVNGNTLTIRGRIQLDIGPALILRGIATLAIQADINIPTNC